MEAFGQLSEQDRSQAIQVLRRRLAPRDLRAVIEDLESGGRSRSRKSVEWIIAAVENESGRARAKLPEGELAEFLVDRSGFGLLESRALRERLALSASEDELETLHDYRGGERSRGGSRAKAKKIAERTWRPGKSWPRHFTRVLDIPPAFAGLPGSTREPDTLEVAPFVPLRDLEDFQQDLKEQVIEVLSGAPGANRGVLTLPTGAGKTRTAVESLIEWRISQPRREAVLWIAQSEELCEQAVQAFREVWTDLGHRNDQVRHTMEIARLWGSASVPSDPDIVVASIQKLDAALRGTNDDTRQELELLRENLGAVVVDEAHRMLAPSYSRVLRFLAIELGQKAPVPVIGLTATPFRRVDAETRQLAAKFHSRLLGSRALGDDIVSELRRRDVLSRPEHKVLSYAGSGFQMDDVESYREHFDQFEDFHPGFLREIGESDARNRALLKQLLELPPDWATLFFGCTVEHSIAMAVLLRRAGRAAEVVTSNTRSATRRALIEQFRGGRLSVLCNYGVLTTGFDAPAVRALVVGRPTTSPVLYEQMIGRGMRGPRFGGTESCLVVDIEDNIHFSGQLAYKRYSSYWSSNQSRP
ncbi:DEAD/DEAH box helicase [Streptomyces glycanivorans]|uniref:DEAD/DEAH box helicase n=1 Tax=Streptomyces glycanivorans TaxID=3033808 RepID=A0ABY9JIS8_9ACTN|nr:DEAD/DEAH box helicase [Streptomyces sp. Alt3]WLQ67635.1 DEAD/DEAH box helicase [Streptomyces sp. Alt3]